MLKTSAGYIDTSMMCLFDFGLNLVKPVSRQELDKILDNESDTETVELENYQEIDKPSNEWYESFNVCPLCFDAVDEGTNHCDYCGYEW